MTIQIPKSKVTQDFIHAVSLYRQALEDHVDGPAPSADAIVQAAVRRIPAQMLTYDEAMAIVEKHLAEAALPRAEAALRLLQGTPPAPARRTVGLWVTKKNQDRADKAKSSHDQALGKLSRAIDILRTGKLPDMFKHLLPDHPPPMSAGKDKFVIDYEIVNDDE